MNLHNGSLRLEARFKSREDPVLLDIAEVAAESGLAPSALRFYEKRAY